MSDELEEDKASYLTKKAKANIHTHTHAHTHTYTHTYTHTRTQQHQSCVHLACCGLSSNTPRSLATLVPGLPSVARAPRISWDYNWGWCAWQAVSADCQWRYCHDTDPGDRDPYLHVPRLLVGAHLLHVVWVWWQERVGGGSILAFELDIQTNHLLVLVTARN